MKILAVNLVLIVVLTDTTIKEDAMNTNKVLEFFDAHTIQGHVHIIGCGAVGSHTAERLTRLGVTNLHLWDFDKVEPHNITNQMYVEDDIGTPKVIALADHLLDINPAAKPMIHGDGIKPPFLLSGYVFLCLDNIDLRRAIVKANQYNPNIKGWFDVRIGLTDAQAHCAIPQEKQVDNFLKTMEYSHEEAAATTPKSACNIELSVCYTLSGVVSFSVANFVRVIQGLSHKTLMIVDFTTMDVLSM